MTSSGQIQYQMSEELSKNLHRMLYSSGVTEEVYNEVQRDMELHKQVKSRFQMDERVDYQVHEKQQLRQNSQLYVNGFNMTKQMKDGEKYFRMLNYFFPIMGFDLSTSAFLPTIELLGTDAQVDFWRKQVFSGKAIGAYGQTELGHGSDVQQLQTQAVYDPISQTWNINSPTITSAKFWPGLLGRFSTHTVIQAKAIVGTTNLGVQTFVVQIRDANLKDAQDCESFDIGPKLGFERVDNGGISFKNKKLPLQALLMRYVQVTKDGKVSGLQNKEALKYGYGSMLNLRVKLTYAFGFGYTYFPALFYYDLIKKAGRISEPSQRKLIIQAACLGAGVVMANNYPGELFKKFIAGITKKDYKQADKHLISCHITSSTFKALSSRIGIDVQAKLISATKQSVFKSSMLPLYFASAIPSATYEGDNSVLLQQTAKFLLMKYDAKEYPRPNSIVNAEDSEQAVKVLNYIVNHEIMGIKNQLSLESEKGTGFKTIWNELLQTRLIEVSCLWGYMTLIKSMFSVLDQIRYLKGFENKIARVFTAKIFSDLSQVSHYGFELTGIETWKSFTNEELEGMRNVSHLIRKPPTELVYKERSELQARL